MKIILTGSSGFLGQIIVNQFQENDLLTLGRANSNITCDLSTHIPNLPPTDLVIHSAGKAHSVPKTPQQKQEFFDVNVTGTQNLLKGLEQAPSLPKSFVYISSVAVYGLDKGENIKETHPLNAKDPYGLSKIQAEEIVQKWCQKNNVICTILRLPLLVGQNPPGNLGAMIKGIRKGYYFNIAGGYARKSMVMASDVAKFILPVAEIGGIYNLTDGYHPNFRELSSVIAQELNKKVPGNIPQWLAKSLAKAGDIIGPKFPVNSNKLDKITSDLTFDDIKAREAFGWNPNKVLEAFKL
jgi:nucleoside-diphosphate-sugar epimerase